jgi:hypothetical protein
MKSRQARTEWVAEADGEGEKESSGLTEGETECWTGMEMAWVRNGCWRK